MCDQPRSFDPHEPIDLGDEARVHDLAERLDATPAELTEAVEKVGAQPVAVAIYLGCPDAI
jgi:hypothetical protein